MRKLAIVTVTAAVMLGTMGAAVGSAGASVPTASKFCKAVKNIDTDEIGDPSSEQGAATTVKQLKKVQKVAKGNVKKALNTLIDSYEEVVDGESVREAFGNAEFAKALGTFGLAAGKCILSDLPDITIPSLD
jgi:hypothetical protein